MTTVTTSEPKATASREVQAKALVLYNEGFTRQVGEDALSRTYRVREYTVLQHKENIDTDRCTCAWNRYQPYSTAICSHVLAARMEQAVPRPRWRKALLRLAERIR